MNLIARRLRSVLIALAVLALSATAVFAGRSALTTAPAPVASQPDVDDDGGAGDDEGGAEEELDEPKDEDGAADEAGEADEAPDADGHASTAAHPDNHGKLVSEAAHAETPAGFDNHGAWVRSVAKDNHGHADAATRNAGKKNR